MSPAPQGPRSIPGAPYFLVDQLPTPGEFVLCGAEGRHAATVRRLRIGELLVLTDGRGGAAVASVRQVGRGELTLQVDPAVQDLPPAVRVTLVQALPKGERGELAVELATEAGVDSLVPWAAARCIARWNPERAVQGAAKWRATAVSAAKQSRRTFLPAVAELASTSAVTELIAGADAAIVLHESASAPLQGVELPAAGDVIIIVGPEGGLTEEELRVFAAAGAVPVRLGPQVLRTSTAGAVVLGALGVLTGRWA